MSAPLFSLFSNPEVKRNLRVQLRPNKMIATGVICGVISLIIVPAIVSNFNRTASHTQTSEYYLQIMLTIVAGTLLLGGCGACLQSISREKEMNTFDYQRITRMNALELALGKLFGAPVWVFFAALCFLPALMVAAFSADTTLAELINSGVLIVFGSLQFLAFALLLSLVVDRAAAGVRWLLLLGFVSMGMGFNAGVFQLGPLNPLMAGVALVKTPRVFPPSDQFFGVSIPHAIVVAVLSLTLSAWFLLAVARNIKRDPAIYELYTPAQALGLALYVTFLQAGFFRWGKVDPNASQVMLLVLNTGLMYSLGLALLRTRDQARRLLQKAKPPKPGALDSLWPAPYLLAGTVPVGIAVIAIIESTRKIGQPLDATLAMFRVLLLAAWVARDILYLQWMRLRSSANPLRKAVIYMMVFYAAANSTALFGAHSSLAQLTILTPGAALALDVRQIGEAGGTLLFALFGQVAACGLFAYLQHHELVKLEALPRSQPQPGSRSAQAIAG